MIIVTGVFVFGEENHAAIKAAMVACMAETAREDGCITYRFYQDVEHGHLFHVYEEWESVEHLKAHGASAHIATFREAIGAAGLQSRAVKMIEAGAVKDL